MGSMLEMLKNMMEGGSDVGEGQQQGQQPGDQPGQAGDQPGQGSGNGGGSGKAGDPDNTAENDNRRIPRNSGKAGSTLPREFHKAMDAYNKGATQKSQNPR
jgi:hypothetical protein